MLKIDYLAEHPAFIAVLSRWFIQEWQDFYEDKTWKNVAETFYRRLNRNKLPMTLVAFEEDQPLGTVSLLEESIAVHKNLTPWLGGLYVSEERRRQGIGRRLIERAIDEAQQLAIEHLFIAIRKAEHYYLKLGWEIIERTNYDDEDLVIMRFDLGNSQLP